MILRFKFDKMEEILTEKSLLPVIPCLLLSGLFVGSLYVWDSKYDRNHPSTIKKRFFSVFVVILISPFILNLFITSPKFKKLTTFELIGFRTSGFLPAAIVPLFLTAILFLGPICMLDISTTVDSFLDLRFWLNNIQNLIWLRNVVVGPLAEEFTFRACMVPLLLQSFEPLTAVFLGSFFFGFAHIHHVIERYKAGEPYNILAIRATVQFLYTTLFGAYSAFIFLKTGHFIAPFVVHAFCNVMGFPDFGVIFLYENRKKYFIIVMFFAGVVLWGALLNPLLDHRLYKNNIFYNEVFVS